METGGREGNITRGVVAIQYYSNGRRLHTNFLQELYKELILSKQALKRKDQELKDVKGYLDNLLLRIMETNPSLLSSAT